MLSSWGNPVLIESLPYQSGTYTSFVVDYSPLACDRERNRVRVFRYARQLSEFRSINAGQPCCRNASSPTRPIRHQPQSSDPCHPPALRTAPRSITRWFSGAATAGYATASSCSSTVKGDAAVTVVSAQNPEGPFSCEYWLLGACVPETGRNIACVSSASLCAEQAVHQTTESSVHDQQFIVA